MFKSKFLILVFGVINFSYAAEVELVLPEPLTFKATLDRANTQSHFSSLISQSQVSLATAAVSAEESKNDVKVNLEGYIRKVGVSDVGDPNQDGDSKVSLFVKKNLYDFGLSESNNELANMTLEVQKLESQLQFESFYIDVIEAYFDVLRADNLYLKNNEEMSLGFIRFNRAQENAEFGLTSDLDILEAQTNYERIRQARYLSEVKQRLTRQKLAELLGVPKQLPDQLEVPSFDSKRRIIDDFDKIVELALANSLEIKKLKVQINLAKKAVKIESTDIKPTLEAELEISQYERNSGFRDDWRASINFNVPLYDGRSSRSKLDAANAKVIRASAEMDRAKSDLRLNILDLMQTIQQRTVELEGAKIKQDYRDLYLDKSRSDYELEYKTDLGDAMVQYSQSRLERFNKEFDLEIAWSKLSQLVGTSNITNLLIPEKITEK